MPMMKHKIPPAEFLAECFDYDPDAGNLFWKHRPRRHFSCDAAYVRFHNSLSGKRAFTACDEDGYRVGCLTYDGRKLRLRAHRVIFKMVTGNDAEIVDHKDGDRSNNAWGNLRGVTHAQNCINTAVRRTSLLRWVKRRKDGRFSARICDAAGKRVELGSYLTAVEAHEAALAFGRREHGAMLPAHLQ